MSSIVPGDYPGQLPSRHCFSGCLNLMATISAFTNPRQKRENRRLYTDSEALLH